MNIFRKLLDKLSKNENEVKMQELDEEEISPEGKKIGKKIDNNLLFLLLPILTFFTSMIIYLNSTSIIIQTLGIILGATSLYSWGNALVSLFKVRVKLGEKLEVADNRSLDEKECTKDDKYSESLDDSYSYAEYLNNKSRLEKDFQLESTVKLKPKEKEDGIQKPPQKKLGCIYSLKRKSK